MAGCITFISLRLVLFGTGSSFPQGMLKLDMIASKEHLHGVLRRCWTRAMESGLGKNDFRRQCLNIYLVCRNVLANHSKSKLKVNYRVLCIVFFVFVFESFPLQSSSLPAVGEYAGDVGEYCGEVGL